MKKPTTLVSERYRVLSQMGVDALKRFINLKDSGLGYWEAIRKEQADWNELNGYKKDAEKIRKMEWRP